MWCQRVLAVLLFVYLGYGCAASEDQPYGTALSTFVDGMLAEYERESAPTARTDVALALDVRHAAVNDQASTMQLLADLKMTWNDTRLTWNTSQWSQDSVVVPAERLWAPDVELVNVGGWRDAGSAVLRARLTATGSVQLVQRLAVSVPLALTLHEWPNDAQTAVFKFASRAHNQDEINLFINDYARSLMVENGAWEVTSVVGWQSSWERGEEGAVPVAAWNITTRRRGAARAAAAAGVFAAAVLTLLTATALPYTERAPLCAAAAFLAAMWLISSVFHLPAAASTPRLVRVMCAVCAAAAAGGAGAAVAALVSGRVAPPPPALRALLSKLSAHVHALAPDPDSSTGKGGAWAAVAQLFDAVLVGLLLLTLLVLCIVQVS